MNYRRYPDLIDKLAAEYVLGTLRHGARRRFEYWMAEEAMVKLAVARWQNQLNPLAHAIEPVAPPSRLWAAIEAALFKRERARTSWWNDARPWRWFGGVALACSLALGVYVVRLSEQPAAQYIAVLSNTVQQPSIVVNFNPAEQRLELAQLAVGPLPPRKDLELWLIPPSNTPVSLGVVNNRRTVHVLLTSGQMALLRESKAIALSLEPKGGSRTGAPTGPILFSGAVSVKPERL